MKQDLEDPPIDEKLSSHDRRMDFSIEHADGSFLEHLYMDIYAHDFILIVLVMLQHSIWAREAILCNGSI